jgi:hypothetical protein
MAGMAGLEYLIKVKQIHADAEDKQGFLFDFDDAWQWAGYSRKDSAKRVVLGRFQEGVDYKLDLAPVAPVTPLGVSQHGGDRRTESILFTFDALRRFLILSKCTRSRAFLDYMGCIWDEADTYASTDETAARRREAMDERLCEGMAGEPVARESRHDEVADRLADRLGGRREVQCRMGRVDVLTDEFAIEVKPVTHAAHGLGQALLYAAATSRRPWVHLFYTEGGTAVDEAFISALMRRHGVKVTFEYL